MSLSKEEVNKIKRVSASEEDSLSRREIRQLIPSASTNLCETGFPNFAATKTKHTNRVNAAPDLRIQLSNTKRKKKLFVLKITNMWRISF
jgi:hypothetical protein